MTRRDAAHALSLFPLVLGLLLLISVAANAAARWAARSVVPGQPIGGGSRPSCRHHRPDIHDLRRSRRAAAVVEWIGRSR